MLFFSIILLTFGAAIYKTCGEYYFRFIKSILAISHPEEKSDEEIFFGNMSLMRIEKTYNAFGENKGVYEIKADPEESIKIIQEEKPKCLSTPGSPIVNVKSPSDDSLQIESMMSDLSLSPITSELNNTLEDIEYTLKNGPKHDKLHETAPKENLNDINNVIDDNLQLDESSESIEPPLEKSPKTENLQSKEPPMMLEKTPKKKKLEINEHNVKTDIRKSIQYFTPIKLAKTFEIFITPSSRNVNKTLKPWVHTPAPLSNKKTVLSEKRTSEASEIKNSRQEPLDKINIDNEKMPQSQWAKKITFSSPRPTVNKHENREMNLLKKSELHKHEASFANLSCVQAELSLCTQESAFETDSHF